jgi:hypothetical protein
VSEDSLYLEIMRDTRPGEGPFTVRDITKRWGTSEKHSLSILEWMTERDSPPTMKKIANTSPQMWRRI